MDGPSILLLDIETLPNVVTSWGLKVDGYLSHDNIVEERSIICAAWKWLGESRVYSASVLSHPSEDKRTPDLGVLKKLHGAITLADAIIAHNGDRFDMPWIMTRLIVADMHPPPPVPVIDTRAIAKLRFYFNSNRLDYLGKYLGVGRKIKTEYDLWLDAMKGDRKAIRKMVAYNEEDVRLLERVYLKLRPFVPASKLNRVHWVSADLACPSCGEASLQSRGLQRNAVSVYQRFQCTSCGAWSRKPSNSTVVR